jgi:hypothetical protein
MLLFKLLEVTLIVLFDVTSVAIPLVDAGIQIWNGVTINEMVFIKNKEWGSTPAYEYSSPLKSEKQKMKVDGCKPNNCSMDISGGSFNTDPAVDAFLNSDFSKAKNKLLEIYISEYINFEVTYETLICIVITQLPALCLAFFGIIVAFQRHGLSSSFIKASLHSLCLGFVPFCFVELFGVFAFDSTFIQIVVEKGKLILDTICGDCLNNFMQCLNLLHFLPNKDSDNRDKMLAIEVIKVMFGTCLQFCFQVILCLGYTKQEEIEYSQIFSIVMSFFVISKLGVDVVRYKRETIEGNIKVEEEQFSKKINKYFKVKVARMNKENLIRISFCISVLISSVTSNTGCLILAILVMDWYAAIYVCTVFSFNLLLSLILPFTILEKMEKKLRLKDKLDLETRTLAARKKVIKPMGARILRGVYISWSNIFFISRPIEDTSYYRMKLMALIQIMRFPLNLATLIGLMGYIYGYSPFSDSLKINLFCFTSVLMVMGILNVTLLIYHTYTCYRETGSHEVNNIIDYIRTNMYFEMK